MSSPSAGRFYIMFASHSYVDDTQHVFRGLEKLPKKHSVGPLSCQILRALRMDDVGVMQLMRSTQDGSPLPASNMEAV
eukprot:1201601-Amphidinium_carterae.1